MDVHPAKPSEDEVAKLLNVQERETVGWKECRKMRVISKALQKAIDIESAIAEKRVEGLCHLPGIQKEKRRKVGLGEK